MSKPPRGADPTEDLRGYPTRHPGRNRKRSPKSGNRRQRKGRSQNRSSKPSNRRQQNSRSQGWTPRSKFVPNSDQLRCAERLIIRSLKRETLIACNDKDAVHQLLNRFGKDAHQLGRTIEEKAVSVHRVLLDLMDDERVTYDGDYFRRV